jgi:hypothetical protein
VISRDNVILIFGSINGNVNDRTMTRQEISTLQYLDHNMEVNSTDLFSEWGELGLSSLVLLPDRPNAFFLTTGRDIFFIDSKGEGQITPISIPKLRGVHEISIIENVLWISNTYYDEVIAYDYNNERVMQRLKLSPGKIDELDERTIDANDEIRINKFHCNQIFQGYDKRNYLLVHHVTGEQTIKRVAQKLIKSQGGGGVVSIDMVDQHKLKMKAPHSVRKIYGEYWVFDSGHSDLNIYDRHWSLQNSLQLGGWGRGGCLEETTGHFFAGLSSPRRRYFKFLDNEEQKKNKILAIDAKGKKVIREWELDKIEQVNNLYCVPRSFLDVLYKMAPILRQYESV